jgi:hypothetical protein
MEVELAPVVKHWLSQRAKSKADLLRQPGDALSTHPVRVHRILGKLQREYIQSHLRWEEEGHIDSSWRIIPPPDGAQAHYNPGSLPDHLSQSLALLRTSMSLQRTAMSLQRTSMSDTTNNGEFHRQMIGRHQELLESPARSRLVESPARLGGHAYAYPSSASWDTQDHAYSYPSYLSPSWDTQDRPSWDTQDRRRFPGPPPMGMPMAGRPSVMAAWRPPSPMPMAGRPPPIPPMPPTAGRPSPSAQRPTPTCTTGSGPSGLPPRGSSTEELQAWKEESEDENSNPGKRKASEEDEEDTNVAKRPRLSSPLPSSLRRRPRRAPPAHHHPPPPSAAPPGARRRPPSPPSRRFPTSPPSSPTPPRPFARAVRPWTTRKYGSDDVDSE